MREPVRASRRLLGSDGSRALPACVSRVAVRTRPASASTFRSRRVRTDPAKARAPVYHCQETLGLRYSMAAGDRPTRCRVPELESGAYKSWTTRARSRGGATRRARWRTRPLPVGASSPLSSEPRVRPHGGHARPRAALHNRRSEAPDSDNSRCSPTPTARPERRSRYELHLPLHNRAQAGMGRRGAWHFFASQPESASILPGLLHHGPQLRLGQCDTTLQLERVIFGQDHGIVESQRRPEQVPFGAWPTSCTCSSTPWQSLTAGPCRPRAWRRARLSSHHRQAIKLAESGA